MHTAAARTGKPGQAPSFPLLLPLCWETLPIPKSLVPRPDGVLTAPPWHLHGTSWPQARLKHHDGAAPHLSSRPVPPSQEKEDEPARVHDFATAAFQGKDAELAPTLLFSLALSSLVHGTCVSSPWRTAFVRDLRSRLTHPPTLRGGTDPSPPTRPQAPKPTSPPPLGSTPQHSNRPFLVLPIPSGRLASRLPADKPTVSCCLSLRCVPKATLTV